MLCRGIEILFQDIARGIGEDLILVFFSRSGRKSKRWIVPSRSNGVKIILERWVRFSFSENA